MKCLTCKAGPMAPGTTTVTIDRGGTVVIVRGVPAHICQNCGAYELDLNIAKEVEQRIAEAVARGMEVAIMPYAA